ncbi:MULTISPECIES: SapC family protein [unclassified Duganella]|uniref:SapC family protein n=1 Tax=unclassified Duganella TaxID=2636909 RepID=UPI000E348E83|nr:MULTISPECIES: SapC family protein [unclassified Duganella]RFP09991.1 peptidase [Duganella sp. BJB475]RFP25704.1 peptidase [Duganella sp. BJB476]
MSNTVLLNNVDHKDLRIITRRGAQFGERQMSAVTFPAEFRDVQACYPIVFRKTTDGLGFEPIALFGFQEEENLFLNGERWDAPYVPMMIARQPFMIGVNGSELMVHIDANSPRVSRTEGEPVFKPHGGNSEFLEQASSMLLAIHQGLQETPALLAALLQHELLESFVLDVELNDGSQNRLVGFYTINEDKLSALGSDAVAALHQAGHLRSIYMVLASLSNFRMLIDRKNAAHA